MERLRGCCALLLLSLLPVSSMAKDTWAINCGGDTTFTSVPNVTWEPDADYVHGGVSRTANDISDGPLRKLRAFEAKKPAKGCYTIPVGIGTKVLVRAFFYYGNYDGMGVPPSFWLQFDANPWKFIKTAGTVIQEEVVYVAKTNETSICVARGSTHQTPFISALVVAVLSHDTYDGVKSSQALFNVERTTFGAKDTIVDKFFRLWYSATESLNISDYRTLKNSNTSFDTQMLPDDVPPEVLHTAITPYLPSSNITIKTPYLQSTPQPIYYNMYFTEPLDLAGSSGGYREFQIYMDGQLLAFDNYDPVIPPYGHVIELYDPYDSGSNATIIELVPTANATLPPVISAWELFLISDELSNGTDGKDVRGLSALQKKFKVLLDWAGDPCLPKGYNWEWTTCNSDPSPRVTKLRLSGYGLAGKLPDFSSLEALQTIDMSNNSLIGDIPAFLGELPNLQVLNLADNDLSTIPSSLTQNTNIQLNVSGNPKLLIGNHTASSAPASEPRPADGSNSYATKTNNGILMAIFFAVWLVFSCK